MVTLPSGEVLVVGGTADDRMLLATTEVYDPSRRTFRRGPDLQAGRYKLAEGAAALPDRRVVVAGGGPGVEVVDVRSGSSAPVPGLPAVRSSFSTVSVLGDAVLVVGGYDSAIRLTRTYARLPIATLPAT